MMHLIVYPLSLFVGLSASAQVSENYSKTNSEVPNVPQDRNSSVQYLLYTPSSPENVLNPCYIEPNASVFDNCAFNSSQETKFIIHGYQIKLKPGNLFEQIKNRMLEFDKYNVIIVNWTKYNQQEYDLDVLIASIVGVDVAEMINFLILYTNVSAESIHLIGHSLGAHIAGVAGKLVPGLGRITGLDPAGPGYSEHIKLDRLTSRDAELVDAIHTSIAGEDSGFGTPYPMAWINFYPNGLENQPHCQFGKNYTDGDGIEQTIVKPEDLAGCNHDSSITYFINSILTCNYLSFRCINYKSFESGRCYSEGIVPVVNLMGFRIFKIPGLPDHSKFYLDTSENSPFC